MNSAAPAPRHLVEALLPVAVVKRAALAANIRTFAGFCRNHGVSLAPHGKTTMSPQIIKAQLAAGAWGITAATVEQARRLLAFGVRRVVLASEVADPGSLRWLAEEAGRSVNELYCFVDSLTGVQLLGSALRIARVGEPLPVLVERGHTSGRTGCRTDEELFAVAAEVARTEELRLAGLAAFEGTVRRPTPDETREAVAAFLREVRTAAVAMARSELVRWPEMIVSAGGSAYIDVVVDQLRGVPAPPGRTVRVVVRSGCYVTHDSGFYDSVSPLGSRCADPALRLQPALEVWGAVLSRPEPGLALVGMGKRDVSHDSGLPVPRMLRRRDGSVVVPPSGLEVTALNDQHAYLRVSCGQDVAVGDLVGFGISHPCTTFDKWRSILLVDDDYTVVGMLSTEF